MNKNTFIITLIGVLIGAVAGYLYYKYVGCITGTCVITSRPLNATLYGALIGGLLSSSFIKKEKK
ncbi:Membrane protein [Flavobacterium daejeonense]|nr:Membrane protein [Flavobacterium daejeonense]